ncbi:growth arrest and DNA-damage-inducible protein [Sarotherodon galilaeus]
MTRGGRKPGQEEQPDEGVGASSELDAMAATSPEDKLEELTGLVKSLMRSQAARDQKWEKDLSRQEQRWKGMQHQFQQIQLQVNAVIDKPDPPEAPAPPTTSEEQEHGFNGEDIPVASGSRSLIEPKLFPLSPEDDIEHFLTTFERMANVCRWPRDEWAIRLVPLLTGKARTAYILMDVTDSENYDKVKEAILAKYEITADTYRRRFRSMKVEPGETPRELYVRLKDLFSRWIKPEKSTVEEISEQIILEQFLRMVNPELEIWIREHDPNTAKEAASLAEVFTSARKGSKSTYFSRETHYAQSSKSIGGERGSGQVQARNLSSSRQLPSHRPHNVKKSFKSSVQDIKCYHCHNFGHTQQFCPALKSKPSLLCAVPRPATEPVGKKACTVPVLINGRKEEALLDSGCFQTLVHSSIISGEKLSGVGATISCVHGDEHRYPTAEVYLTVGGQTYLLVVAVVPSLPYSVILGNDIPTLFDLIHQSDYDPQMSAEKDIQGLGDESGSSLSLDMTVEPFKPCHVVTRAQSAKEMMQELPFFEESLETEPGKIRKSRAQKRSEKFKGSGEKGTALFPKPNNQLEFDVPSDLGALQRSDPTLKPWFEKVTEVEGASQGQVSCLVDTVYLIKGGILYQRKGKCEAIALPQQFRNKVMDLGHSIPWAGHMAFHKTLNRISSRFVWPGMYVQVSEFCRSCEKCQLTSGKGVVRAQLQPLPIIETPFERLGMDIVGPLERSSTGHRYILVICDYATRFPEAFPLRSIKARHIANCLLQLFSRVGIPREILTDCGTNFLSKLLQQVYKLLGIKGLKTTPYHPQTDGLVERYNQTLKSMLRKFVSDTGADWDQWLPYLLFAYREVPQVSTGFSPFELLYGRQVRGPLDLLKDCWEDPKAEGENIAAYVITMRERLEKMASLVQDNMKAAQKHQKTWYDQKARDRVFLPGQKVLLLLPTSDNKLLTKWHGPYEIVRQVSKVTYELNMPERVKKYQTFHVNLLKEFHSRQEPVHQLLVRSVKDEEVTEKFFPTNIQVCASVDLSHLSHTEQADIKPLVDPQLFRETPGFTSLVQHKIRVKEDAPVRQKSYRIPERLVPVLQKEIKLMLDLGIIEVSSSEWCSPIVLVPKKDDTLRFCIDFRYLNAVSKFDPYPMPRVDDLLERVGSARYITTLDLCKGYWQVALAPEAKELTAFKTPFGMYQFKVMPFGLQGAPATFQRLMDHVLRDVSAFSAAYLDDVVVYSQSWEEHVIHLQKVLHSIRMAGLTINPKKCSIAKREVEYLGFVVGSGKIKPQVGKIEAIQSFPVPTTKRKVRGFLGLVGWYRKFIPSFAERSTALNDLTKGSAPNKVRWTEDCEQAFRDLKEAVCTHPVLHSPDFNKPFILQTDASGVGLGAVLQQEVDGERRPVVFLSRKLLDRETRYSTVEKECLAMKWAIEALRYYLLGRHFTLETDHRALQWLNRMRDANARIAGWYLSLQPYDFTVQYRPGKSNVVADCLSRMSED